MRCFGSFLIDLVQMQLRLPQIPFLTNSLNKEKLTEDIGRMNSNRQVLFFELNKACKNRDILLNQNKELLETVQGFKGVGGKPFWRTSTKVKLSEFINKN